MLVDAITGWDDFDWSWKDEGHELETASEPALVAWLQDSHMSLSPAGDLLVLANGDRIVFLTRKSPHI